MLNRKRAAAAVAAAVGLTVVGVTLLPAPHPCSGDMGRTPLLACVTPSYGDSTPPTVSVTAPAAGATVSGASVPVTASASDNVAVVGVQFKLDGVNLGSEDTVAPYAITWNSTGTTDGFHTLTAFARDAAGNSTTSASVTVTVSNSVAGTAHVWISSAGVSGCTRNASAVSYATALGAGNVCDTGPTAYTKAAAGDTVLVEGALTVTSQWNFAKTITKTITAGTCNYNYGGTPDYSQCVTIKPDSGQSLTFNVGGVATQQVAICVSGLSIQNATFTQTTYTEATTGDILSNSAFSAGAGDNGCGTVTAPHDDLMLNNIYGGAGSIKGGVKNFYVVGGTATSVKDLSWQFGGSGDNGVFPYVDTSGIIGVEFQGYNFVSTPYPTHHMECVHANGNVRNSFVANSKFEDCPVEGLFFETLGSTADITGDTVENNVFVGGAALKWDCAQSNCTLSNNITRFNSFSGSWLLECSATTGNVCNMNNNTYYGNVAIGCAFIQFSHGGTVSGTGFVSSGYNVQTVPQANTCTGDSNSLYSQTVTYTNSAVYDLSLSGAQAATNEVPNSVTWPLTGTNILGAARSGANTNAGAY